MLPPFFCIVQILLRPEHLALVEFGRIEQIKIDLDQTAIPPVIPCFPACHEVIDQTVLVAISVMIECEGIFCHKDMVAVISVYRLKPIGPEAKV